MAETFAQECELAQALHLVNEDFVGLRAEGQEPAARTHLQIVHFVRVRDLRYRLLLVTVPEVNRSAAPGCDQLKLVVFPLTHGCMEAVLSLT